MAVDIERINEVISRYDRSEEFILAILQDFQKEFHYVPQEGMERLSEIIHVPQSRIYAMSTFYNALSLEPKGRHTIKVCTGTACHLKGAVDILETVERELDVKRNSTTEDKRFSVDCVNCVGACAMAPVIVVDDDYHGHMSSSRIMDVLKKYK
ncbi:MAG: NAD(P)H-dependent oxidoreductase subunit E [Thermodesulfobacteriota bacterium]|nr:NAD(P)H-dependent oxidoreductase subunit E [Thermodesulfobacteriota bacterium]